MFPKPVKQEKARKPLNRQGKKGRANQQAARARRHKAHAEGWLVCEIAPILKEHRVDSGPCIGEITLCHSLKSSARLLLPEADREFADNQVCGGCQRHHYFVLDLMPPATTYEIVFEAIARRSI